jgi:hypothetical protein
VRAYLDFTVYKIVYSDVDANPEVRRKLLKELVGASGFEPPTSWSRTRRSSQAEPRPDFRLTRPIVYVGLEEAATGLSQQARSTWFLLHPN